MKYTEYKQVLEYELYRSFKGDLNFLQKLRIKYLQPNTNCMYMVRKMWWMYSMGGVGKVFSKILYIRIIRKYGCVIFPSAVVGKGFYITHPTGIVVGKCNIGEDFVIYQNCTIGTKNVGDGCPTIGDDVHLCTGSVLLGNINIANHVYIGACSLVIKDIKLPGVYGGNPLRKIK